MAGKWGRRLLPLLFAASVVALVYYLFKGYLPEFHTDSAVKNLLAAEVIRESSYFPDDWNYVNGDLWVVFGQAFIIPLLPFLTNNYTLHAVSGLISALIVLSSLWFASSMVIRSRWLRFVVVTTFAGGVSVVIAENLYGQVSYGNVLYLAAFTLYFGWRWLEATATRGRVGWAIAFLMLSLLTFWGNPQRAAAYDAAPMLVATAAWAVGRGDVLVWRPGARRWVPSPDAWRAIWLCAMLLCAAVVGMLLHSFAMAHVNNAEGAGAARWLAFEGFARNVVNTLHGMLGIFGGIPPQDQRVISPSGIYYGVRLFGILTLLAVMPFAISRFLKDARPSARMFAAFVGSGLCLFVFLQITTNTPDMTDPITSARYMLPSLVLAVVVVAAYAEVNGPTRPAGLAAWMALLVLLSSLISPLNPFSRLYRSYSPSIQQQLAADLRANGLQYGYATYWNSGVVTVLSGGEVSVRQVLLKDGMPFPHRHLASNHWYRPNAWKGPTFLALRQEELKDVDRKALFAYTGNPEKELRLGDFTVWVFPNNISAKMPGWDKKRSSDPDPFIPIDESSRHAIGQLLGVADERVLRSEKGQKGFLHFGPYIDLPAGRYQLALELESNAPARAGYVEVVTDLGGKMLASQEIAAGTSHLVLDVNAESGAKGVEIRVYSNGEGAMTLHRIAVLPQTLP